jgi:hypothetical protein
VRIRQIKPGFWKDSAVQKNLTPAEQLLYIGLWMQADDAGWFRIDVEEIGAELRPFDVVSDREAFVRATIDHLVELRRIERHGCNHALIPTLIRHQRFAGPGKRMHAVRDEHLDSCGTGPAENRGQSRETAGKGTERKGTEKGRRTYDPFEEIEALIRARWGWQSITAAQKQILAEVADRLSDGLQGVRRIVDDATGDDPIKAVLDVDRRLKADGRRRAEAQEAESARWRERPEARRESTPIRVGELLKRAASRED